MEQEEGAEPTAPEQVEGNTPAMDDVPELPEKFKWEGKEHARDSFLKERLMQSDYTKKMQEVSTTKAIYEKHLSADLPKLQRNPALLEQFKRSYPKELHYLGEMLVGKSGTPGSTQPPSAEKDPEIQAALDEIRSFKEERQTELVERASQTIDSMFSKFQPKYVMAPEGLVLTIADSILSNKKAENPGQVAKLIDADWERAFKSAHEVVKGLADKHYSGLVNQQKEASARGKDMGTGGGIPGDAPKKMTIREATAHFMSQNKAG